MARCGLPRPILLPVLLSGLLLAGCFGEPSGAGDRVVATCRATDPATGQEVRLGLSFTWTIGAGGDRAMDRLLAGKAANATFASPARDEQGRRYCAILSATQEFDRRPSEVRLNRSELELAIGPFAVGSTFKAYGYNATIQAIDGPDAVFALDAMDGKREEFPSFGLALVHHTEGNERVRTLQPIVGTTFSLQSPGQIALPLPAGSFRVLPTEEGRLRFGYVPSLDKALLERDLAYEVKVLSVLKRPLATDGHYGVRQSPLVGTGTDAGTGHGPDDGHDHTH